MSKKKNNKKDNKKSKLVIWCGIGLVVIALAVYVWNTYSSRQNYAGNYEAERTSTKQEESEDSNPDSSSSPEEDSETNQEENPETEQETNPEENQEENSEATPEAPTEEPATSEEQIGAFSTKIYNKEKARQNNINITCSSLNNTTIANGATFSFCSTVGPATTQKGYQKADIFDKNGRKKKGLGGGNCQISTTLYNAVAGIPSIKITERHQHSNYVPYIEKGKDAAVAYGGYDLKFVNSTGNDIKIKASSDGNTVNISVVKLVSQ